MSRIESLGLYTPPAESSRLPAGFLASLLFHGMGVFVVSFGVFYVPPLDPRPLHEHLAVRRVFLESPDKPAHPALIAPARKGASHAAEQARAQHAAPPLHKRKAPQLLLQPELPTDAELVHKLPLPTVVIWTAENQRTPEITPPAKQNPVQANATPAPDAPNLETTLADASLVPTISASLNLPVPVAATTPIRVEAPTSVVKPPSMSTLAPKAPTSAAIMALGELEMRHGVAVLPAVNETATESNGTTGLDTRNSPQAALRPIKNPAAQKDALDSSNSHPTQEAHVAGAMGRAPASQSFESADEQTHRTSQITLARDGQFGAVVVGASLEDQYPQLANVWRGRMAYTVYLHVGLRRSWTLEYAIPAEDEAAQGGAVTQLEAPWPFSIVRPNLASGSFNADALMVHGYVNTDGHFEDLELAFPADFAERSFVLHSLSQWHFRPATADGKPARVEVLLVIPEL